MSIQLVSRDGCHLCELAEEALAGLEVAFERLDVDSDEELLPIYDFRVPVLLVDGQVAAEGLIDQPAILRALATSRR